MFFYDCCFPSKCVLVGKGGGGGLSGGGGEGHDAWCLLYAELFFRKAGLAEATAISRLANNSGSSEPD